MSDNKFKYFTVTTTSIVKAPTKRDAETIATSNRRIPSVLGKLLSKDIIVERISAVDAHEMAAG
jgi:hypothetical protein